MPPATRSSTNRSPGLVDEDRQQADDDRQHAESFGEAGKDDREAADLAGSVRVAPDGTGGEAAQDADADARSDDPDGRQTSAEVFHSIDSSCVAGSARRALDRSVLRPSSRGGSG